jgi:hypothetical protein
MSLSMHRVSVPVFVRGLNVLSALLDKASGFAQATGLDPEALVGARLAPDMLTLAGQVQRASDTSKLAIARLGDIPAPPMEDDERSLDDLRARIASTIAYIEGASAEVMAGSEGRTIELNFGAFKPSFTGEDYLLGFALPNFFFHVTTAYDILRAQGVPLGKLDYLGPYG